MTTFISRIVASCCMLLQAACSGGQSADEAAITSALMRMFDKPEAPLAVGPIAVAGDAALADWTQGTLGGRALLKRRDGEWSIELCAGDNIKSESALALAGLSREHAHGIVAELDEEEQSESPERLRQIASFSGVVRVHGGSHPAKDAVAE